MFKEFPEDICISSNRKEKKDLIHYFETSAEELNRSLKKLKEEIKENGMIWVSWPKRSSKVKTDITEDLIRIIAIRAGLVDVKVCAVNEVWSGLKLVIPVKNRLK